MSAARPKKPERARRKTPPRGGPIRQVGTASTSESASSNGAGYTVGAAVDNSVETARRLAETADAAVKGVVERGVETAYMVIDEYMRRGRQAADRRQERTNGGKKMADNQNSQNNDAAWARAWGPMAPMMTPWIPVMRMWTDAMTSMVPGASAMGAPWMNQFMPGSAAWPSTGARPKLSVEVTSQQPAEVTAEIDPRGYYAKLTVDPLQHSDDKSVPAIASARVECSAGHVRVHVTVPNDQPSGRYVGRLHDESSVDCGTITLELKAPPSGPARANNH